MKNVNKIANLICDYIETIMKENNTDTNHAYRVDIEADMMLIYIHNELNHCTTGKVYKLIDILTKAKKGKLDTEINITVMSLISRSDSEKTNKKITRDKNGQIVLEKSDVVWI